MNLIVAIWLAVVCIKTSLLVSGKACCLVWTFGMVCMCPLVITLFRALESESSINNGSYMNATASMDVKASFSPLVFGGIASVIGLSAYSLYMLGKKRNTNDSGSGKAKTTNKKWYQDNKSEVLSLSLQKISDLPRSKSSKSYSLKSIVSTKNRKRSKRHRSQPRLSQKSKSSKKRKLRNSSTMLKSKKAPKSLKSLKSTNKKY